MTSCAINRDITDNTFSFGAVHIEKFEYGFSVLSLLFYMIIFVSFVYNAIETLHDKR